MSETQFKNEESDKKSNDIQARREARRRKILENSKSRLEKLNGRKDQTKSTINGLTQAKASEIYPDPEIYLPDIDDEFSPNINFNMNSQSTENPEEWSTDWAERYKEFNPMLNSQFQEQQTQNQQNSLITSKLHLVIITSISIFTYALFVSNNEKYVSYRVFFPLFIWEIMEILFFKNREKPGSMLMVLLMLSGIPANKMQPILKIIDTLNKVFKDVGVFVFVFVFSHLLYSCFDETVTEHGTSKNVDMGSGTNFDNILADPNFVK